jgi:tetratricopeptide (TPR) repeat protein
LSRSEFEELLSRAKAAQEMGRPETGIPLAMRAVALEPGNARALCTLAWLQQLADRDGESLRTANRAVAADPEYEWAHRLRGWALWSLGRPQAAADALAEAVRIAPTEVRALWRFAWFASLVGRAQEAFDAAQRAVELAPDHDECWFSLGWAAWALNDWDAAENALRRARSLSPQDSGHHNNLGILLARRGRYVEALSCFERALELDPRSFWSYRNAAYCLRSLGRWEEAESLTERDALNKLHDADRLLEKATSPSALTLRARALATLGRFEEAQVALEQAVELAANRDELAMPLRALASNKLRLGDDTGARRLARRLLRQYPEDRHALRTVSWIGWLLGDAQLATRAFRTAVKKQLDPKVVAACAAEAALASGDWTRAERHLLRRLELGPFGVAECCEHAQLAVIYHHRGDPQRARAEVVEATRAGPRCGTLTLIHDRLGIPLTCRTQRPRHEAPIARSAPRDEHAAEPEEPEHDDGGA